MKVVCVENILKTLTIGKIYDVIDADGKLFSLPPYKNRYYWVKGDDDVYSWKISTLFMTLDEYRNSKLNIILDDNR